MLVFRVALVLFVFDLAHGFGLSKSHGRFLDLRVDSSLKVDCFNCCKNADSGNG